MKAETQNTQLTWAMAELPGWSVEAVPAPFIDKWWGAILPELKRLEEKAPSGWAPARVRDYIMARHVGLFVLLHEGEYSGFFIIANEKDGLSGEMQVIIWMAHTLRPGGGEAGYKLIEELARSWGCAKILFHSARDGWLRRAESMGFRLVTRTYEKVL